MSERSWVPALDETSTRPASSQPSTVMALPPNQVRRRVAPSDRSTTYASGWPSLWETYATRVPSGANRGVAAGAWSVVRRQARPPETGASQTSSSATKATWSPWTWGYRR
nr:hypothetical protein GCM10025730_33500 [Promicromonospora thailandica]